MLRYLRENTGNWIIKIFLGIIVIVFVFLGVGSFSSKRNASVATINDEPITIKEYEQAYKQIISQYRARFGNNLNEDLLKALNVRQQALENLVEQKIMLSEADKLQIIVSDKELQDNLLAQGAFQKDGKFDLELYKAVLSRNSLNPEIYEKAQIDALRQEKLKNMVLSTVNVSDQEATEWYIFQNTKMAVDYILFDPESYSEIEPKENQVKKYYADNKESYKTEQKRKVVYLKFSPEDHNSEVKISNDDIQAFYNQQIDRFKEPEKVEARHILLRAGEADSDETVEAALKKAQNVYELARKGEDFEELAKKYSEGPTKDNGGYLGKFEKASMVKPFADKAFSMKPGEISEPVKTRFGWHIIQVISRSEETVRTLDQVKAEITEELKKQETQNLAYYKAGEAFDAVIDGDDFEQVALISGKKVQQTNAFGVDGRGLQIAEAVGFAQEAFGLELDSISDVKQLGEDYYLIKVVEKIDPAVQAFDLVKDMVKKDLIKKMRIEKSREDAEKAAGKAVKNKSLIPAAGKSDLEIKSTKLFARNGSIEGVGNLPAFSKAAFSLNTEGEIYPEMIESPNGFYVIAFKERKMPEDKDIEANLDTVKNELKWRKQLQSYQTWITELKKQYDIQYDPNLLN